MEYNKIVLFDDRDRIFKSVEDLIQFKDAVCKAVTDSNKKGIVMSSNTKCIKYFQTLKKNEEKWSQVVLDNDHSHPIYENWMDTIKNKEFTFEDGTLVFCDYCWEDAPKDCSELNQVIYDLAKDKKELVFFCYSTVLYENAQKWVNSLYSQEHSCKLIKYAYTFSYDFYDFVESTREAILYDWK